MFKSILLCRNFFVSFAEEVMKIGHKALVWLQSSFIIFGHQLCCMHCAVSADIVGTNEVLTVLYIPISKVGTVEQLDNLPFAALESNLELVRYRFFKSVSVFVFLVGFFKSRYRFRYRFFKISRYRFRFFRTNLPLLIEWHHRWHPTPSPFPRMGFGPSNYKLRP